MASRTLGRISGVLFWAKGSVITSPRCLLLPRSHKVLYPALCYSTTASPVIDEVDVHYRHGLPVISVPLPSRLEKCQFTLKPITNTVGDFLSYLQKEDGGIDRAAIYSEDDLRIAKSTTIEQLFQENFKIMINDRTFQVKPPALAEDYSHEKLHELSDVKTLIGQLYSTLNVETHQLQREKEIKSRLENLKSEIQPLEDIKNELTMKASKKTNTGAWVGLALMGVQFGFLARLTWWEYSWDIMEPVTYFITYGTSIAMYAYFVLTKREYIFPDVKDREFLIAFHNKAKKAKLDVSQYNRLREEINSVELDLLRLRDPLQLHLPIQQIQSPKANEPDYNESRAS
ncbi:calcium uniporter protein, mitochondrial-like [Lineus longissimus]|uniref:calcium uniporter protein, mitochondrial-like n=1 Tax=Lineus longissimus TaxID=88925 RepID=UPI002B4D0405